MPHRPAPIPSREAAPSRFPKLAISTTAIFRAAREHRRTAHKEKAKVLVLNLRNRIIFKAADEEGALDSTDFLGKKRIVKETWGVSAGQTNRSYAEHEEHKIKTHIPRALPKHTAVLVHCEHGFKRTVLPPIEPNGRVSRWFRRRWL